MLTDTETLRTAGYRTGIRWADTGEAIRIAQQVTGHGDVVRQPWLTLPSVAALVRRPALVNAVADVIGADIALEGGFLLIKWPGADFRVPWHQDGAGDGVELDPNRSVTVWVALTAATAANGALHVIPGSHRLGYLPTRREDPHGGRHGRALTTVVPPGGPEPVVVEVPAGEAALMDVRLLHSSPPNTTDQPRVGLNLRCVAPGAVTRRDGLKPQLYPIAGPSW
ncbi:phytanoyl-CoA dioxygenase family protein [Actinoplanes flavus]|uniref:Phytanoyl-CoA dioxygenase family protein n=1 Tax=Actinoplanes flavus TaxID=2820290 RepID=A0ABS3UVT4_9ACTN|nr:phytanoyl-CoA dioxygenase family protein [Actinoplanes flavus]MBO3742700.1 phytanoyl-CoA dioxygenase family protein [Actinoplanes flavus]